MQVEISAGMRERSRYSAPKTNEQLRVMDSFCSWSRHSLASYSEFRVLGRDRESTSAPIATRADPNTEMHKDRPHIEKAKIRAD